MNKEVLNKYKIDIENIISKLLPSFINVFGKEYEDVIKERLQSFEFLNFIRYEDVKKYLINIKKKCNFDKGFNEEYKEEIKYVNYSENYITKKYKLYSLKALNEIRELIKPSEYNQIFTYLENIKDMSDYDYYNFKWTKNIKISKENNIVDKLNEIIYPIKLEYTKDIIFHTSNVIEEISNNLDLNKSDAKLFFEQHEFYSVTSGRASMLLSKDKQDQIHTLMYIKVYTLFLHSDNILNVALIHEIIHTLTMVAYPHIYSIIYKSGMLMSASNSVFMRELNNYNLLNEMLVELIAYLVLFDYLKNNKMLYEIDDNKLYDSLFSKSDCYLDADPFIHLILPFFNNNKEQIIEAMLSDNLKNLWNVINPNTLNQVSKLIDEYYHLYHKQDLNINDKLRLSKISNEVYELLNIKEYTKKKNM